MRFVYGAHKSRLIQSLLNASLQHGATLLCSHSALFFHNSSKPLRILEVWTSQSLAETRRKVGRLPKTIFLIKKEDIIQTIYTYYISVWFSMSLLSSENHLYVYQVIAIVLLCDKSTRVFSKTLKTEVWNVSAWATTCCTNEFSAQCFYVVLLVAQAQGGHWSITSISSFLTFTPSCTEEHKQWMLCKMAQAKTKRPKLDEWNCRSSSCDQVESQDPCVFIMRREWQLVNRGR